MVMVSVVDLLPVTDAGLKLHALWRGRPSHDVPEKRMVPVYPGWPVTVNMAVPLPPGRAIVIDGGTAAKAKSGWTSTMTTGELEPE